MSDWQDIATAPKDGTPILLYDPVYKIQQGSFAPRQVGCTPGDARVLLPERWVAWSNRANENLNPTHWMPLPEPPEVSDE